MTMNSQISQQDENDKSLHNTGKKKPRDIDWRCRYCSHHNNEQVSWAVFGDDDAGREGARVCIICYEYSAR
jgi:hypothetical protein